MTRRNFQFQYYLQPYVIKKKLTPEQGERLAWLSYRLRNKKIRELIDTDVISMETALHLRDSQWNA